jgi:polyhydroxyalkanoate synthesis regulator phasin
MMDANKDGKVTREEGRAAMQKMMQQRTSQQTPRP